MPTQTNEKTLNFAQRAMIFCIKVYRFLLSPWLGQQCRFYPSCSYYTQQAVQQHGAIKGFFLGSWRLLKCHPFHRGGYDPVPSNNSKGKQHS